MKKIFLILVLLNTASLFSQNVFIPREISKSIDNGVRTYNGTQGNRYWQNTSDYKIDVTVDSYSKILSGKEDIVYSNNSPDELDKLVLRTYQDFSIPGKSRDWEINENNFSEGMKISSLIINGENVELTSKDVSRAGTNLTVKLNNKISSGTKVNVSVVWSFKILKDFPRMGMYDETSYMIAYWYPQIAVYDDIDGWDMINYQGQVEFYNDFNNYDVKITTDRPNMCVWATGLLQNPDDVFLPKYLEQYKSGKEGKDFFLVDCSKLNKENQITKNDGKLVWNFKATSVMDFAFAMSDHYVWKMKEVEVSPSKTVNLNIAFRPNASALNKYDVFNVAFKIIEYLSTTFPGVPFPFPSMTVFNGEGGMEFPMMVNNSDTKNWESTVYLTSHEISHSYFPFYMGINERKYAWMDEGWAVYLPQDFQTKMERFAPDNAERDTSRSDSRVLNVRGYLRNAGTMNDIPMLAPSNQLRSPSYRHNAYNKAALVYDVLKDMLGKDKFNNILKEYVNRWNGKHPTPYDFFNTFNDVSGENLDWFWEKWFMVLGYTDLRLGSVIQNDLNIEITIDNVGGMPVPVELTLYDTDNNTTVINRDASVWKTGNTLVIREVVKGKVKRVVLGNKYIPDLNPKDNEINIEWK